MALPPQMVDMAMGAGGPAEQLPEEMMVELPAEDMLPEGIELAGMEEMHRGSGRDVRPQCKPCGDS